ncbi:hypothetical protein BXZ70DRAFT_77247 [Cristinia sonorae]|uniref:Secreted protein n=1 Tax=Cristinia sonorae TaxID=1940300 RepID=A0A8K0URL4_9AGAR|nr:hypothetical protein BXZ70DRAFT_77247 [Cristinia sonorae]
MFFNSFLSSFLLLLLQNSNLHTNPVRDSLECRSGVRSCVYLCDVPSRRVRAIVAGDIMEMSLLKTRIGHHSRCYTIRGSLLRHFTGRWVARRLTGDPELLDPHWVQTATESLNLLS